LEIRQLRHFLAVMETKSYWRAAEQCSVTPQALSKSIRRFEVSLGVRLFDRDSRSVRPTLFADKIAAYARTIDAEARSLRRDLDELLGAGTNQLSVGAGAAAATTIAAEAILAVRRKNPKLMVTVIEGTYESLMPQLGHGKLDVVVSIMTTDKIEPLIDYRVLHVESYVVIGRAGHPLSGRARVPLAELSAYPWMRGVDEDQGINAMRAAFEARGLTPPRAQFKTDSLSFAVRLATQSDALFLIPREMVQRDLDSGLLTTLDVDAEQWTRPTAVFFRKNSTRSPDSIQFLRELKKIVARNAGEQDEP
jgi:DNA-binding transcriptional LysR family regulator